MCSAPVSLAYFVIVRLTLVECCREPLVPVMPNVYVPVRVLRAVETVRVEFAGYGGPTGFGLKVQVLCKGQPETLRLTFPLNPLIAETVAVYCALEPRLMV